MEGGKEGGRRKPRLKGGAQGADKVGWRDQASQGTSPPPVTQPPRSKAPPPRSVAVALAVDEASAGTNKQPAPTAAPSNRQILHAPLRLFFAVGERESVVRYIGLASTSPWTVLACYQIFSVHRTYSLCCYLGKSLSFFLLGKTLDILSLLLPAQSCVPFGGGGGEENTG